MKREANTGLGKSTSVEENAEGWWQDAYASNLKSMKGKLGTKDSKKKKKTKTENSK